MSTLLVANVQFDAVGTNKIYYDGANLNVTSANVNITGRLTANAVYCPLYYDSSNTSFYVDPAANSVMHNLRVTQMGLNSVSYLTKAGINNFLVIINNKLFSTSGTTGTYSNFATGRGATGTAATFGFNSLRAVNFPGETGTLVKAATFGSGSAYALFNNGNLYTWGYNGYGQLGVGDTTNRVSPTLASTGVSNVFTHPSSSDWDCNACRIFIKKTDNYIYAAGYNAYGQLGDTTVTQRNSFQQLTGLGTTVTSVWPIGAAYGFTYFQKADNSIWACGYNSSGNLGNATTTNQSTPVDVTAAWGGLTGSARVIKKVIGGSAYHNATSAVASQWAVMLLDDGTTTYLRSAGNNTHGTVGNGTLTAGPYSTPITPTVGAGRISTISGGGGFTGTVMCLMVNGDMYIWGWNFYGQLGNGTTTDNGTPTLRASGVTGIYYDYSNQYQPYVSATFYTTSAGLYSSGYNGYGQLGLGDTTQRTAFNRVLLPGDFTVADIGSYNSTYPVASYLAVGTDGRMYAWGYNGQQNITAETTTNCLAPIQITLPLGA
jgi:alpha-tubulin suppressor-like RCC1 family protein